jgi:hypothetical protein
VLAGANKIRKGNVVLAACVLPQQAQGSDGMKCRMRSKRGVNEGNSRRTIRAIPVGSSGGNGKGSNWPPALVSVFIRDPNAAIFAAAFPGGGRVRRAPKPAR